MLVVKSIIGTVLCCMNFAACGFYFMHVSLFEPQFDRGNQVTHMGLMSFL